MTCHLRTGSDPLEQPPYLADLAGEPAGAVTYTPLCNARGGVEADLTVTKLAPNEWYFAAGGNTATKDFAWRPRP